MANASTPSIPKKPHNTSEPPVTPPTAIDLNANTSTASPFLTTFQPTPKITNKNPGVNGQGFNTKSPAFVLGMGVLGLLIVIAIGWAISNRNEKKDKKKRRKTENQKVYIEPDPNESESKRNDLEEEEKAATAV